MLILNIILSILFLMALRFYPKFMVYFCIYIAGATMISLILYSLYLGKFFYAVIILILLIAFICIFNCFKEHIDTAISLSRLSAKFLTQAP
jgi:hypothetical protein